MSTIAFCMYPELGHILPTLRLAQGLRSAGHKVVYSTFLDYQDMLEALGFETVALMAGRFPRGTIARLHRMPRPAYEAHANEIDMAFRRMLLDDEFDWHLQALAPDLLLCDILLHGQAIAALSRNISCYRISTALPDTPAPGVPPLTTSLPYGDTPERRLAAEQAWHELLLQVLRPGYEERAELERRILDKYGFPEDAREMGAFGVSLCGVPELILCSSEFDFPRPPSADRHYIESLALERASVPFPWDRLHPDKPLMFCSLGTQSYRIPGAQRFFSEVVAAAASRPDWQFVVALGERWSTDDVRPASGNTVMVPFAPQERLLPRSSVVITHAGLGTIKESISFGVPMLAFPLLYDQPGNGARIAYHGLGEVGNFDTVTAPELVDMIERVRTDRAMAERLAAMRRAFEDLEQRQPGLALIQKELAAR